MQRDKNACLKQVKLHQPGTNGIKPIWSSYTMRHYGCESWWGPTDKCT